jgi:hypothetical protein
MEHYDPISKFNLFKRQITSSHSNSKQPEKFFVRFLGLSSALLGRFDHIHPNIIKEIVQIVNYEIPTKYKVPNQLINKILHFVLYVSEDPES